MTGRDMEINIIKGEAEYRAMCRRLDAFFEAHADDLNELSPEAAEELKLLTLVIGDWEDEHYPVPDPDPVEFIKFMMEQKGLKVKDIAPCFGTASRAYEVLNRKRGLTLAMIRKLRIALGCSADALIEA